MSIKKRARAALTAVAAMALVFSGSTMAIAAPGNAGSPLVLPGTEGQPITGTVTVHKHEQESAVSGPANGLPQTVASPTIAGVTFSAQKVESVTVGPVTYTFDLATNEGWLNAAKLVRDADGSWTFDGAAATPTLAAAVPPANTGAAGGTYQNAVFADLPIGLYYFQETEAPAEVTKSVPWLMTVPLTHPTDLNKWLYDIHVYPKNSITTIDKIVKDDGAQKVGDSISWTITGEIPMVANPAYKSETAVSETNLKFFAPTAYVIKDNLDERLTPATTNPIVISLVNGGTVSLDADDDYEIAWDSAASVAGADLTLTFTEKGLNKLGLAVSLSEAPADVKVQVVLTTTITSLGDGTVGDGIIKNQAQLFPNEESVVLKTPILSPEPESRWGDILIEKVAVGNAARKLKGAEFQVFTSEANALAGSDAVTIDGESTFRTGEDGVVRISGLRHSDFANNAVIAEESQWQYYWIVESKSPDGYELLAKPIRVAVTAAQQTVDTATQIENAPHNGGFELPLTGSVGTWLFTAVGGALLIAGALLLLARKKKSNA